ncbi:hypothetical protein PR001_g25544 [Phytophthora rubi]|uniref:Maltose/galactoside acetyltransferase domain-containing protein n=2 Tax=Phytophthora rubi TaxID=129364 RepID=A0A6A3I1B2_9STRA|nr:hypothetical protein PR002_g25932 [Phytophthora rubi]KAE8976010.1 hypothetical protein PR001_g25544 [Phytophthora rubi]
MLGRYAQNAANCNGCHLLNANDDDNLNLIAALLSTSSIHDFTSDCFATMVTEKAKMIRGELYIAADPTLAEDRRAARELTKQFNDMTHTESPEGC